MFESKAKGFVSIEPIMSPCNNLIVARIEPQAGYGNPVIFLNGQMVNVWADCG